MRVRVVLVWMLLALLPVRGWATLVMQLPPSTQNVAMAKQHGQAPCHDMAAGSASTAAAADAAGIGSHAGCSMCDLCHSAAACNAQSTPSAAPNGVARVQPVADADTGRALVGALERPPRNLLV